MFWSAGEAGWLRHSPSAGTRQAAHPALRGRAVPELTLQGKGPSHGCILDEEVGDTPAQRGCATAPSTASQLSQRNARAENSDWHGSRNHLRSAAALYEPEQSHPAPSQRPLSLCTSAACTLHRTPPWRPPLQQLSGNNAAPVWINLPVLQLRLPKEKAQTLILHCKGPSQGN